MNTSTTVQDLLLRAFRRYASRTCLVWEGGAATYAATARRVRGVAGYLQAETNREASIAILLPNSREFIESILACALAARVRVPLNTSETIQALAYKVASAECALVITTRDWHEELRGEMGADAPPIIEVGADYECLADASSGRVELASAIPRERYRLSFTGGTTGAPKAVIQRHRQELALVRNLLLEAFTPRHDRVFVASTPLAHAAGTFVLPTALLGGQLSWTARFDPERLLDSSWLEDGPAVQTFVVPTALADLARSALGQSHTVDTVLYGGAPCPTAVLEAALEAVGPRLVQLYGQAEASMTICHLAPREHDDVSAIAGCAGFPFLFVDVAIERDGRRIAEPGEVGEIVVRSDHVMDGYWRDKAATSDRLASDGALRTQDLGYCDDQGRVWIVGRSREMFISGGYNVFPAEVERRLGHVEGAREIAVFSVPHPRWGEASMVAVVPEQGIGEDVLTAAIDAASRRELAPYERPKHVVLVGSLPRTAVGKVARSELSSRYATTFNAASA